MASSNYIARHWRGELSGRKAFWLSGFVVPPLILLPIAIMIGAYSNDITIGELFKIGLSGRTFVLKSEPFFLHVLYVIVSAAILCGGPWGYGGPAIVP
jgi:hypothetical protein